MQELTRRPLVLVAALTLFTACQSADRSPVGSTPSSATGEEGAARAAADPVPVPGAPGSIPVPGRGGAGVPGKPAPVPVPGSPQKGPAPGQPDPPTPAPSATPTPDPGATPLPPPPAQPLLEVTNVQTGSGTDYPVVRGTNSGSSTMGPAWIDYPYVLQRNFGAGPDDPLYMIRTAIADTSDSSSPMVSFDINRCARVMVFFADDGHTAPPYPSWISPAGFTCSIAPGGGGTTSTWYHETLGSSDQISGPVCSRLFAAGGVELGPREPTSPESRMYAVFVQAAGSFDAASCPP